MKRALIKVNGINIFYRDTETNKLPIVCLHGKWGRGETWSELMNRYMDRFRIIAPDLRGHGLSDKPVARYSAEDLATDIYELIHALKCEPVLLVGHSMGGRVAAYLTALYPETVKALVILDSKAEGSKTLSEIPPEKIEPVDNLTKNWPIPYLTYDDAVKDLTTRFQRESNVRYFLDSLVETVEGYDFMFSRFAMAALDAYFQCWYHILEKIVCPVLFIRAKESWLVTEEEASRMKACIKNCIYHEISNSNHMVYADNPDEFYSMFDKFVMEHQSL